MHEIIMLMVLRVEVILRFVLAPYYSKLCNSSDFAVDILRVYLNDCVR